MIDDGRSGCLIPHGAEWRISDTRDLCVPVVAKRDSGVLVAHDRAERPVHDRVLPIEARATMRPAVAGISLGWLMCMVWNLVHWPGKSTRADAAQRRSAKTIVRSIRQETVIGPMLPGTGAIASR